MTILALAMADCTKGQIQDQNWPCGLSNRNLELRFSELFFGGCLNLVAEKTGMEGERGVRMRKDKSNT